MRCANITYPCVVKDKQSLSIGSHEMKSSHIDFATVVKVENKQRSRSAGPWYPEEISSTVGLDNLQESQHFIFRQPTFFKLKWWTAIHWSSVQNWAWAYYHITEKRWGGWEEETQEGDGGGKAGFCNNKSRWQMLLRSFSDAYQILWKNFIIGFTCSKIGKTMGGRRVTVALFGMVIIWKPLLTNRVHIFDDRNPHPREL